MNIMSLLSPELLLCKHSTSSKKRILEDIADHISEQYQELESSTIFSALIAREKLGSTGIGGGIAIPHCRISQCEKTIGMLITLANGIDFNSIDNLDVDIIFVLLVPEDANENHLQTLASVAETFSNETILSKVRHAQNTEELMLSLQ